jgi:hypothetical protein
MENISDWIDGIIQDLVNPEKQLKDTFLKVQVLSFKLKNDRLKIWVDSELNGYVGKDFPDYRIIPSAVYGDLIQNRGFGGFATRNNTVLPIEFLDKEIVKGLITINVTSTVSEIERMISENGSYQINIPHIIQGEISKVLANGWKVDAAWQIMSLNSLEGILSSIKSNLLTFLLELNQEIGNNENYSIMDNKKKVENLFDKTIGNITGETVNVQIGNKNIKTISKGDNANLNIAQGEIIEQELNIDIKNNLEEFSKLLKKNLENLGLNDDDKEDILNEVQRINSQLSREKPKLQIINTAIYSINGILTGITANAYTPIVLEKLGKLISIL